MPLKILTQKKNMQTSSANSEHKHSEIECFSTLNKRILKTQKTLSLSIVNKFSHCNQSLVLGVD